LHPNLREGVCGGSFDWSLPVPFVYIVQASGIGRFEEG
jgi:hypothetical protein